MAALEKLLPDYPDIHVELSIDASLTDIVAERFDAGVRLGEAVAKDMIAVRDRSGPADGGRRRAAYFAEQPTPTDPHDLAATHASTCACRRAAASMRGNWRRTAASSTCASTGSSPSTT